MHKFVKKYLKVMLLENAKMQIDISYGPSYNSFKVLFMFFFTVINVVFVEKLRVT